MEEDKKEEIKKPENEETGKVGESKDAGEGDKPKENEEVERLNAETERINKAIAENENAKAREKLGGVTTAGNKIEEPKKLTETEAAKEYIDKNFAKFK